MLSVALFPTPNRLVLINTVRMAQLIAEGSSKLASVRLIGVGAFDRRLTTVSLGPLRWRRRRRRCSCQRRRWRWSLRRTRGEGREEGGREGLSFHSECSLRHLLPGCD